jgi:hypothetical protein
MSSLDDALLKQASLARLQQPRQYDLEFLRSWFRRPGMGSFPLLGLDRDAWDTKTEGDLVAIKPRQAPDVFSKWFTEYLVPRYHHIIGKKFKVILLYFSYATGAILITGTGVIAWRCRRWHIPL